LRAVTPGPTAQPLVLRDNEVIQWGPRSSARSLKAAIQDKAFRVNVPPDSGLQSDAPPAARA